MAISAEIGFFPKTVTWNSNTWSNTSGGTMRFDMGVSSEDEEFLSGADIFPQIVNIFKKNPTARLSLGDVFPIASADHGATSNLVMTVELSTGSTREITLANAKLMDVQIGQGRGSASETVLDFKHVSADGTTFPLTETTS